MFSSSKWSGGQGDPYPRVLGGGLVPRWLAAVGNLLHSFSAVWGDSKASPVLKLDVERWQLLLKFVDTFNCSERRLGQKQWLSLGLKSTRYITLFIGFLDRIVDGKNPNTFLVRIELYLTKIRKKSRRG
jgi:hypothetical protein